METSELEMAGYAQLVKFIKIARVVSNPPSTIGVPVALLCLAVWAHQRRQGPARSEPLAEVF